MSETQPLSLGDPAAATPATPSGPSAPPPGPLGPQPTLPPGAAQPSLTRPMQQMDRLDVAPKARKRTGGGLLAVGSTALVLGLVGGLGGAAIYDKVNDDSGKPGTVSNGLDGVETVSLPPVKGNGSVAAVAEAVLPSTVQIAAQYEGTDGGATGSGFVLDTEGHIITNDHVVADADENDGPIEIVDQNGERYEAEVVGRSPDYDIAVLIAKDAKGLKPASLGASNGMRVGDGVVAIGSPLGLNSTVTSGIVSALRRPVTTGDSGDDSSYISAVQTDAAINPGNSGGPLVNLRGQVVGVNSAIATNGGGTVSGDAGNIGVGFAIPIEQVKITVDQILRTGEASVPVIGAEVSTGGVPTGKGAELRKITPDTPAEEAGLEKGDIVTAVDGERVLDGISLIVLIRSHQPGQVVEFTYQRDGEKQKTDITLDARED